MWEQADELFPWSQPAITFTLHIRKRLNVNVERKRKNVNVRGANYIKRKTYRDANWSQPVMLCLRNV
jgi:hypothetical protein